MFWKSYSMHNHNPYVGIPTWISQYHQFRHLPVSRFHIEEMNYGVYRCPNGVSQSSVLSSSPMIRPSTYLSLNYTCSDRTFSHTLTLFSVQFADRRHGVQTVSNDTKVLAHWIGTWTLQRIENIVTERRSPCREWLLFACPQEGYPMGYSRSWCQTHDVMMIK